MAISTFVGREQERARLIALVREHRLVTVVGPGGMGKTRLADESSAEAGDGLDGGVRRSELAHIAPDHDVAIEIAGALGFPSREALLVGLQESPSLLVLDNCEHVRGAVAQLCSQLLAAVPSLRLLATSREPLGVDGEQVMVLGPLALPEGDAAEDLAGSAAVRLFADRARAAGARNEQTLAELEARAELCRRLDGVPLAIELAAARSRALSASEILSLLDRRFDLLRRDAPVGRARHRSLRAAIDASYALLDADEQQAFRALGVFRGPFSGQVARDVLGSRDQLATIDLLGRLVDRSLVTAEIASGSTRYRLLESLRDYAAERATEAGEWEPLMERFVDAMVAEADRIVLAGTVRWSPEVLATILQQFDALVAAIDHACAVDADRARAFRLMLPLWGATHQGRAGEVAAVAERVLARGGSGDEPLRAEATVVAASSLLAAGRIAPAADLARGLLEDETASPLAQCIALRTLGLIANEAGRHAEAVGHFARGRSMAAEAGLAAFARELAVLADSTAQSGAAALDGAIERLSDCAEQAVAAQDPIAAVWAWIVAAHHLLRARRVEEARAALSHATRISAEFVYPFGSKATSRLRAVLQALTDGWEASRAAWLTAVNFCAGSGDLTELALTLRDAAEAAALAGDDAARATLLAAVPPGVHPVVLGGVLADTVGVDAAALTEALSADAAPLQRVRELLSAPATVVSSPATGESSAAAEAAALHEPLAAGNRWVRSGDAWTLTFAGRSTQIRHLKGLEVIAVLLSRPGQEVHCLDLIGSAESGADPGDSGPALDEQARQEYRSRVRDLQQEIDEARDANDVGRAHRAEAEMDVLVQQLSHAFGLGGRARPQGSAAERARSAVSWRLRAAIRQVRELHPELGRHLTNAVRTGTFCSYQPETPLAWELSDVRS